MKSQTVKDHHLLEARNRFRTDTKMIKRMVKNGVLLLDPGSDRLVHRNELANLPTTAPAARGSQTPHEDGYAGESVSAPLPSEHASEGPDDKLAELEEELRAEREEKQRLLQELEEERANRIQDDLEAQRQMEQVEAELENLRRDHALTVEILQEDLEEERLRRIEAEEALESSAPQSDLYGRLSSTVRGVVSSLTDSGTYEDRHEQGQSDHAIDFEAELEQQKTKVRELEENLSEERAKRLRLEDDKRLLDEVRALLLGATQDEGRPALPEAAAAPAEAPPETSPPDESSDPEPGTVLLETPYGQFEFFPPFALSEQEAELLRLAAQEEITADQIRHLKGRRAPETLNDLLDRLEYEEANPIVEVNDRYSFDPNVLQSD